MKTNTNTMNIARSTFQRANRFLFVKKNLFLFLFITVATIVYGADPVTVSGIVTDKADGEPMIGITIIVKGTNKGVITDVDGNFKLSLIPGQDSILSFTYIGYKPLEKKMER